MNERKLDKWAELLLDTGKRNNLVNFRETKMGTVEVLFPDFVTLFNKTEHSAAFKVYDPKLENEFDDEEKGDSRKDEYDKRILSAEETLKLYKDKIKRQQILVYNNTNKPISALKQIGKKAQSAIEETGVNIAYLSFGFINWTENENSEHVMKAPLLLVPITIENESSVAPYVVKVIDDEIIVNPTFSFKLQNEYGIKLPEFDDEGIEAYLRKVENTISKLKWKVSKVCKIGIFSFLKINMYRDIKENAKKIAENTNVKALLGEASIAQLYEETTPSTKIDLLDLHNVVDADSSQGEAIELALMGKSFVLQGPPGTGKSQTITNIIAESLLAEKKVLFVSEKLAALNVVYEKLKSIGLEEFCLELHSHKANKSRVIDELYYTLKLHKSGISEQAEKELKSKKELQKKLNDYTTELHKIRLPINKSLYKLYEEVSACRKAPDIEFIIKEIHQKGDEYIEKAEMLLGRYTDYDSSIGYDYHQNCWYGYSNPDCSFQSLTQVKHDLSSTAKLCKSIQEIYKNVVEKYGIVVDTIPHSISFGEFFCLVKDSEFILPELLNISVVSKVLNTAKEMHNVAKEIIEEKAKLDEVFNEEVYELDGHIAYEKLLNQFSGFFSRLFNKEYNHLLISFKLCKKDRKKPGYSFALKHAKMLCNYQHKMNEFNELQNSIQNYLGTGYCGVKTKFDRLILDLQKLEEIIESGISFEKMSVISKDEFFAEKPMFKKIASEYFNAMNDSKEALTRLASCFDTKDFDLANATIPSLKEKCEKCYNDIGSVDNWHEFSKLLKKLDELELKAFVDDAINKKISKDMFVSAYKKTFYIQWVDFVLHQSPVLLELSRIPHDETVRLFKEKDKLLFEINKAKIKAVLSAKRPELDMIAQGSSVSALLREGEKKRKKKGIRSMLSKMEDLVQTLKPCFLMSPLSVSTYLSADIKFDVVIFDEASQIFPQDAIGAIYRGKQLIVVGDSKQMPPSNFFGSIVDIDSDEEDEDVTDFESILDMCSTILPQCRLKWHYRSRNEQLISFSNKNFYDNELVTFPSTKKDSVGNGIDYVHVNGIFDRKSKTNLIEAEKVVDMIFEHIEKYPHRSLGVVAFSIAQQTLIDKLLSKRRQENPLNEEFFKYDKKEPFFVKNLETVQGDERDTIIFSIAYARDSQGRFILNFGPINREGGERRLNVAVSRAKYNVKIVSSLHCSDIDLSNSRSVGVRLLREYLDYAENGNIALERSITVNPFEYFDSEFEMEVYDYLCNNGYSVDTQVGCSSFRIDLAVKHPDSSEYVLAVECDGASYHSSKTARDRDRLRQDILEKMGWNFYRIWSTDWFRNKQIEKERLLSAVKDAIKNSFEKHENKDIPRFSFEQEIEEKHFEFPIYVIADISSIDENNCCNFQEMIKAILEVEAPLSEELLLKRIVHMFYREKVTNVVRTEFEEKMRGCKTIGIIRKNGFLYLKEKEIPILRVPDANSCFIREIKQISIEELATGMKEILKRNIVVEKKGLFQLLIQKLGFSRMGESILERLETTLKYISSFIIVEGDMISLKQG